MIPSLATLEELYEHQGAMGRRTNAFFHEEWAAAVEQNSRDPDIHSVEELRGKFRDRPVVIVAAGLVPGWVADLEAPKLVCSRAIQRGYPGDRADMVFAYDSNNAEVESTAPLVTSLVMRPEFIRGWKGPVYAHSTYGTTPERFPRMAAGGNVSTLMMYLAVSVFEAGTVIFVGHQFSWRPSLDDMLKRTYNDIFCEVHRGKQCVYEWPYYTYRMFTQNHIEANVDGKWGVVLNQDEIDAAKEAGDEPPEPIRKVVRWIKLEDDFPFGFCEGKPTRGLEHMNRKEIEETCRKDRGRLR